MWFAAKKLLLNEAKTQNLVRTLSRGHKVNEENSVKLLGFVVDHKFSWGAQQQCHVSEGGGHHVSEVVKKLSRVVFLLRKLKSHVTEQSLVTAHHGLLHSHQTMVFKAVLLDAKTC